MLHAQDAAMLDFLSRTRQQRGRVFGVSQESKEEESESEQFSGKARLTSTQHIKDARGKS
jgi:hypothetical protein